MSRSQPQPDQALSREDALAQVRALYCAERDGLATEAIAARRGELAQAADVVALRLAVTGYLRRLCEAEGAAEYEEALRLGHLFNDLNLLAHYRLGAEPDDVAQAIEVLSVRLSRRDASNLRETLDRVAAEFDRDWWRPVLGTAAR